MSYRRNFTIGRRETRNFYLTLVLGSWRKGIAGFGAVGALAALLYMPALSLPLRGLLLLAGAAAGMGLSPPFLGGSPRPGGRAPPLSCGMWSSPCCGLGFSWPCFSPLFALWPTSAPRLSSADGSLPSPRRSTSSWWATPTWRKLQR